MESFCSHCHETVEVKTSDVAKKEKIRGREIEYLGREAVCTRCGERLYPDTLNEENQALAKEAFREQENLVSVDEIQEILKRYKIGKRPLSLLLGWGEGTLTRYISGDLPTRQYSATLRRIMDDPSYFEEILEENRKSITTQAYQRSKKALEMMGYVTQQLTVESLCSERMAAAAGSILAIDPDMSLDKLQIMLYYLQGFHFAFWREEMFPEECYRVESLPEYKPITTLYPTGRLFRREKEEQKLSETEKLLADNVMRWLGCFGDRTLKKLVLAESFCFNGRNEEDHSAESRFSHALIRSHFTDILNKYNMISIMDIADYARDLALKM